MRKLLIILALVAAVAMQCAASDPGRLTAIRAFTEAPDTLMRLLPRNTRLDMVDYFNSSISRPSENVLGGKSQILNADSLQITFDLGTSAMAQIALLPAKADTVIVYIETLLTPVPDSEIRYFTSDWQPIAMKGAADSDTLEPWLADGLSRSERARTLSDMPFMLAEARFDSASGTLRLTNRLDRYYGEPDRPLWLDNLKPAIALQRKGRSMMLVPCQ